MKFLALIFILTLSSLHAEDNCGTASVNTENMPKNNDQSNLAWCFAWSAADLISFYEARAFSSYDIALKYHNRYPNNDPDVKLTELGGSIDSTLVMLQNTPSLCLEKDTNYTDGNWGELSDLIQSFDDDNLDLSQIICSKKLQSLDAIKNLSSDILKIIQALPRNNRLAAIVEMSCGNRQKIKDQYSVSSRKAAYDGPDKLMNQLDEILSKNEPVSIGYDIDQILKQPEDESAPYPHASTVIGRRLNPKSKQCEYLIKNSWGNSCPKKSKVECMDGNLWVAKEVLKNSLSEVSFMIKNNNP